MQISADTLHWIVDVLIGLVTLYIGIQQHRSEKIEDRLAQRTDELVESKMKLVTIEMEAAIDGVKNMTTSMKENIGTLSDDLRELFKTQHKNELHNVLEDRELKDWVHQNFATKGDIQELQRQMRSVEQNTRGLKEGSNRG